MPCRIPSSPRLLMLVMSASLSLWALPAPASPGETSTFPRGLQGPARSTAVFAEDWEGGIGGWYASNGVWVVGTPAAGAHGGTYCAGTVISGYYPNGADSRLISPSIALPSSPLDDRLWLSLYQFYSFWAGDTGRVEISAGGGPWQTLSVPFVGSSGTWSRYLVDISTYAGQSVRIAFHLRDNGDGWQGPGWYVDDIDIHEGAYAAWSPEGFESGIGGWYADQGVWDVGAPTWGPGTTHGGANCAATVLGSNYPSGTDSRLVSPSIDLPSAPADGKLWLSFYHWFACWYGDTGRVELSVAGGPWQTVSAPFVLSGGAWTRCLLDLSAYAGQPVRVAFHFQDTPDGWQSAGWYVDDIEILQGQPAPWSPEDFESGIGGWHAERGLWQVGTPTTGPGGAHSGASCAATVLTGNYPNGADSRLISPSVALPSSPLDGKLWLSLYHWFACWHADSGQVELSVAGGPWQPLSVPFTRWSGAWSRHLVDLSAYAGQSVRIAFHLWANTDGWQDAGWYVDDVEIVEGQYRPSTSVGFEDGIGGWYAEHGVWEVGTPTSGPSAAHEGTNCAGTVLGGNYPNFADSRFISMLVTLPSSPAQGLLDLCFYHWFSFVAGDTAWVEVSAEGGPWEKASSPFVLSSGAWTRTCADLSPWAGRPVRVAFHLKDNGDGWQATGWYIDDFNGIVPTLVSLIDAEAEPGRVRLAWYSPRGSSPAATLYRRSDGEEWLPLARLTADGSGRITYQDESVVPGHRYGYRLGLPTDAGEAFAGEVWVQVPEAVVLALHGFQPNPAASTPTVAFALPRATPATLEVMDVAGRRIFVREVGGLGAGRHVVPLGRGSRLSPGIYVLRLTQEGRSLTTSGVVVR